MKRYKFVLSGFLILLVSLQVSAGNTDAEIQHLLLATGQSDCTFVRNGEAHPATEAESHLRMKYGRGKKWVDSAEQFINRIASKSSWTGKPYFIECPDSEEQTVGSWLTNKLHIYRDSASPESP